MSIAGLLTLCVSAIREFPTPIEARDEVAFILKEAMEEAGKALLKTLPFEAGVLVLGSGWFEISMSEDENILLMVKKTYISGPVSP
jgi:hypothetical protein